MSSPPRVTEIRFHRAGHRDLRTGLLGFVSFLLDGHVRVDGVTVRETLQGRRVLSFPAKKTPGAADRPYLRPVNNAAREAIEEQILEAIGVAPWRPQ